MHAMLALSASHLSLLCVDSFSIASLIHRQQAIKGLHSAFSSWPLKPAEAHVMLATSYILAFQSQYMEDGLVDHVLSLRGCALLSQVIVTNNLKGAFVISPNLHCTTMSKRLDDVSPINIRLVCDTLASLERLTPLLENSSAHEVDHPPFQTCSYDETIASFKRGIILIDICITVIQTSSHTFIQARELSRSN
jgi:hypothetical protein